MAPSATVIVPTVSPARAGRVLDSLAGAGGRFETIVVDNGTADSELERLAGAAGAELLRLDSNRGYSRAVNLAAARAEGEAVVLLNDDCVVDRGFVEAITAPLDPGAGVVAAAGVMRAGWDEGLIDTAGIEIDRTLLAFDYLNGEPVELLDAPVADPAIARDVFLEAGGFDENLFAYWEDVDLALRLRRAGGRCRLARDARGTHEHSATLGSGSARKNYLMGYGRGYVLRKWGVLSPRRLPAVLVRELSLGAGQMLVDRNLGGVRGRARGLREAGATLPYPSEAVPADPPGFASSLGRRWRRRVRLRRAD